MLRQTVVEQLPNDPATVDAYSIYLTLFVFRGIIKKNGNSGMIFPLIGHLFMTGTIALISICLLQINLQIAILILIYAICSFVYMLFVTIMNLRGIEDNDNLLGTIERAFLTNFETRKHAFERRQPNRLPQQEELPQP